LVSSNRAESDNEAKAVVFNNAGIELEKQGSFSEALKNYDEAARTNVTNIVYQRNSALLLCRMGRTQEAIRRLNDILTLEEDDPQTLQILAVAKELAAGNMSNKKHLPAAEASR
jgi:predicted Zn-dependent protease